MERVDRFNNDPECFCFLISTRAGGVGLNLSTSGGHYECSSRSGLTLTSDSCRQSSKTRPVCTRSLLH